LAGPSDIILKEDTLITIQPNIG